MDTDRAFHNLICSAQMLDENNLREPPTKEVASVANESAWVFPLLEMCDKLNISKLGCKHLT